MNRCEAVCVMEEKQREPAEPQSIPAQVGALWTHGAQRRWKSLRLEPQLIIIMDESAGLSSQSIDQS